MESRLIRALKLLGSKCTCAGTKVEGDNIDGIVECIAKNFEAGGSGGGGKIYRHLAILNQSWYGDDYLEHGFIIKGEIYSSSAEPLTGKAAPVGMLLHGTFKSDSTSPNGVEANSVECWGEVKSDGSIFLRGLTSVSPEHQMFDQLVSNTIDASKNIVTFDTVTEV